jgi:GNAT superfamily N-acetyltransferase
MSLLANSFPLDVAAIERATVAAVAPDRVDTWPLMSASPASGMTLPPDWLLPMDRGTVGRAYSAVPLSHGFTQSHVAQLPHIAAHYRAAGLTPVFRLPDAGCAEGVLALHQALAHQHYESQFPTWVLVSTTSDMANSLTAVPSTAVVTTANQASADWQALFLGPGMDPVDGAHRVRNLSRAVGNVYVSAQLDGQTVACGAAALGHGWMGVHGMRTAQSHRGRGLAGQVLRAMAALAHQRGVDKVFLQVGADNAPALALYERAGFTLGWTYVHWRSAG